MQWPQDRPRWRLLEREKLAPGPGAWRRGSPLLVVQLCSGWVGAGLAGRPSTWSRASLIGSDRWSGRGIAGIGRIGIGGTAGEGLQDCAGCQGH